jgi:nitrous oxidase accessory protein
VLMGSAAVSVLRMVAQAFPILRAPSIVDAHPRMAPYHANWSRWLERTAPGPSAIAVARDGSVR